MTNKLGFFKRLKALPLIKKKLFAIALCQRMYPNYQLFSELSQFGDSKILATVLALIWQSIYDKKLKFNTEVQLERLESIIPEPKNFDIYGAYPAMDAVAAVISLLNAITDKQEDDMINISKLSSSTVANYIETLHADEVVQLNDDDLADFIFSSEIMQQEKLIQGTLLDAIEESPRLDATFIKELQTEIIDSDISNIGISSQ